jgi:4-methyl-5(b-hydroxyethyl)-thiazole monophosphate biosynthesis
MKNVLLLLANGFEMYEASAFTDVLGWADAFGDVGIELTTAGPSEELTCTFGFDQVTVDLTLNKVTPEDYDAVAIPGGFEKAGFFESAYAADFLDLIREFNQQGKQIASICVGALPIGKSDALSEREATTFSGLDGKRQDELADFGADIQPDQTIVRDDNVVTSTSPGTGIDVAFDLLETLTSRGNAQDIRNRMGFG